MYKWTIYQRSIAKTPSHNTVAVLRCTVGILLSRRYRIVQCLLCHRRYIRLFVRIPNVVDCNHRAKRRALDSSWYSSRYSFCSIANQRTTKTTTQVADSIQTGAGDWALDRADWQMSTRRACMHSKRLSVTPRSPSRCHRADDFVYRLADQRAQTATANVKPKL